MNDEEKYNLINQKYSNVEKVSDNLNIVFDNDPNLEFKISTRKNKKYMVKGEFSRNKWIHFGQMGYQDYTYHNNDIRRLNFKNRNIRWSNSKVDSPAFLSYYILW